MKRDAQLNLRVPSDVKAVLAAQARREGDGRTLADVANRALARAARTILKLQRLRGGK